MSTETAESLQEEIHSLEEALRDRSQMLQQKKHEASLAEVDVKEAEREASDAEAELAQAQEDFRMAEQNHAALMPQYERCQQNKDQHAKAEAYKRQIGHAERDLREAEATIKALEAKLQDVSATYKTERERKSLLVGRVINQLDELRGAVEEKVMLTVPIDESATSPNANLSFRSICEMSREREMLIAQCARHARELSACINLKQQRAIEIRAESDREIAALKTVKDEQVKNLVQRFEEERQSIQHDIDRVRTANAQQQDELHRTKVISDSSHHISERNPVVKRSANSQLSALAQKASDLDREKLELLKKLQETSAEHHKLLQVLTGLQRQTEVDQARHQQVLRNLESQVLKERSEAASIEKENQKLEEMCDVLVAAIKTHTQS